MVVIVDSSYILAISREIINCCHAKLLLVLKINMSTRNLLLVLYGMESTESFTVDKYMRIIDIL